MTNIETKLSELAQRHGDKLASKSHHDRALAVEAAKHAINTACEVEAAAIKKSAAALERARAAQLGTVAESAEAARREQARQMLGELFAPAPDSLPSLVARFRAEPTRAGANAIRAIWNRYNERAQAELGEQLHTSVLGAIFVDDIVAGQPQLAGAINHLSGYQFGANDAALSALSAATKPNMTPAEVQEALTRLDSILTSVALRHAGETPNPEHVARHALRRVHATHRDLVEATQAFDAEAGAARHAQVAATYKAPPSMYESFRRGLVERGLLSHQ